MSATLDERRGKTSASNAEADSRCSARHLRQAGIPDTDNKHAKTGRKIHDALALDNPAGLSADETKTFEMCKRIVSLKVVEFFGEQEVVYHREKPNDPEASRIWVKFNANGVTYEHSCRCDLVVTAKDGRTALIVEYKTLMGEVPESPKNMQLRDQQVLVRGHFLVTGEIGVVVCQPMVTMDPVITIYTLDDSNLARREMFTRVMMSNDPNAVAVAGEVQCEHCKAKRICVEYQRWAGQLTPPAMLNVLEVPMETWTPEQRATAANAIKPAEDFIDTLKTFLKQGLERDAGFVPGWCLEVGKKREAIKNPQVCFERFIGIGGKAEQFMAVINITKGKLKEAVTVATGAKGKTLETAMKTLTDGITETTVTAPSLKRIEAESK